MGLLQFELENQIVIEILAALIIGYFKINLKYLIFKEDR